MDTIVIKLKDLIGSEFAVASDDGRLLRTVLLHHLELGRDILVDFDGITHVITAFLAEVRPVICSLKGHRHIHHAGLSPEMTEAIRRMPSHFHIGTPEILSELDAEYRTIGRTEADWEETKRKMQEAVEKMVEENNLQVERLTKAQTVEVIMQAFKSGDFQRLVCIEDDEQKVTYTPGRAAQELKKELEEARELISALMTATAQHFVVWSAMLKEDKITPDQVIGAIHTMAERYGQTSPGADVHVPAP